MHGRTRLDDVAAAVAEATRGRGLVDADWSLAEALGLDKPDVALQAVVDLLTALPTTPQQVALVFALGIGHFADNGQRLQDRRDLYRELSGVSYRTVIAYEREAEYDVAVLWAYLADVKNAVRGDPWIRRNWSERMAELKRKRVLWIKDDEPVFEPNYLWPSDVWLRLQ